MMQIGGFPRRLPGILVSPCRRTELAQVATGVAYTQRSRVSAMLEGGLDFRLGNSSEVVSVSVNRQWKRFPKRELEHNILYGATTEQELSAFLPLDLSLEQPRGRFLDAACVSGRMNFALSKLGTDFVAVDVVDVFST
jgi:hypothetical protein